MKLTLVPFHYKADGGIQMRPKPTIKQMKKMLAELKSRQAQEPGANTVRCNKCNTLNPVLTNKVAARSSLHTSLDSQGLALLWRARRSLGGAAKIATHIVAVGTVAMVGYQAWKWAIRQKCYECGAPLNDF